MITPWDNRPDPHNLAADSAEETYRGLPVSAMSSLGAGVLSLSAVFHPLFLLVPLAGIALGWHARRRIRSSAGELTGQSLALAGMWLSAILGLGAWAVGAHLRAREIPHGYKPLTYAELAADPAHPGDIPTGAFALEGKNVYVKGYMYPGKLQTGIKQFVMSRDNGSCNFCMPNPQPTDLILVQMMGDLAAQYADRLIGVGGRLRLETDPKKRAADGIAYRIEADYLY